MREIKFRAWDIINRKMYKCAGFLSGQVIIIEDDGKVLGKNDEGFILMQFTGLKDKNGKEIYEGDIVRKDGWIYEIRWSKYGAGFDLATKNDSWPKQEDGYAYHSGLYDTEIIEVIGNVWENNELVK